MIASRPLGTFSTDRPPESCCIVYCIDATRNATSIWVFSNVVLSRKMHLSSKLCSDVLHRHLNHQRFTLAAIDNTISRGQWNDWAELRQAVLSDLNLLDKVKRVCLPYIADPFAQRYHFWMNYVEKHRAAP